MTCSCLCPGKDRGTPASHPPTPCLSRIIPGDFPAVCLQQDAAPGTGSDGGRGMPASRGGGALHGPGTDFQQNSAKGTLSLLLCHTVWTAVPCWLRRLEVPGGPHVAGTVGPCSLVRPPADQSPAPQTHKHVCFKPLNVWKCSCSATGNVYSRSFLRPQDFCC